MSKPQLLRSNKYQAMSDDKILSLYMKNLGSEEKHFLDIEVDIRQLKTEADSRLSETQTIQAFLLVLPTLCFLICAFCRPFF